MTTDDTPKNGNGPTAENEIAPDFDDVYSDDPYRRAFIYFQRGEMDLAEEEYNAYIEENPDSYRGYLGLSRIAFARADFENAEKWANKAHEVSPDSAYVCGHFANYYALRDMLDKSEEWVKKGEALEPDHFMLLYGKGCLHSKRKEWEAAEEAFRLSSETCPQLNKSQTLIKMAEAMFQQVEIGQASPKITKAAEALIHAVELSSRVEYIYIHALKILNQIENPELSLIIAEMGLKEFPHSVPIAVLAMRPLLKANQVDTAISLFSEMEAKVIEIPEASAQSALIAMEFSFYSEAEELLEVAYAKSPNSLVLAEAFLFLKTKLQDEEAMAFWQKRVDELKAS